MKFSFSSGNWWLFVALYSILSLYVVYEQATDLYAIPLPEQVARHERMLARNSEFFNPWQYRVFSTYMVEGFYYILHSLSDRIDLVKSFILFRVLQNILIFVIAHCYFIALGIRNPWLVVMGILLLGFSMAHSVFQSDLSVNTYFDILFYLLAGLLIIKERLIWIIPLVLLAALNRETSLLIPVMLIIPFVQWKPFSIPRTPFLIATISTILFFAVFISVRLYYGYREAEGINGMTSFTDYLSFNLRYLKVYPELIGTVAFLPILTILFLKRLPRLLQQWFWVVCPAWFLIHFAFSTAVESRLFLVPQALIFIPAFLWLIENWYNQAELNTESRA